MANHVILPDLHMPFHDEMALWAWAEFTKGLPDLAGIHILGDLMDAYPISRFSKNPERRHSLQNELDDVDVFLGALRTEYPNVPIHYSEGNHEDRLRKLLWGKMPELSSLRTLTISTQLRIEEKDIDWHPTAAPYNINGLWILHGTKATKHAGMSGRATSDDTNCSVLVGHTHKLGFVPKRTLGGRTDAYEAGHLSDPDQMDYVKVQGATAIPNWQQGWAVVHTIGDDFDVSFVRIIPRPGHTHVFYQGEVIDGWQT